MKNQFLRLFCTCLLLGSVNLFATGDGPFDSPHANDSFEDVSFKKEDLEKFCKQHVPKFLTFLSEMKNKDSDLYETGVHEVVDLYEDYLGHVEEGESREAEELVAYKYGEFRSWQLGKEIQNLRLAALQGDSQSNASAIEQKERELYEILERQYNVKMEYQKREFEEMRKELAELERALKKREALKEQIIRRRMLEISGDDDVMDWD